MNIKIDGGGSTQGTLGVGSIDGAARKPRTAASGEPVASTSEVDRVRLSDTGTELSSLSRSAGDPAPVDMAKVERIRAALANGSFAFDARQTAANLLRIESLIAPAK